MIPASPIHPVLPGKAAAGRSALAAGLVLGVVLVAFEALAVATVLPQTAKDLNGIGLYGWVGSTFMLANLVGITAAGSSADHRGPAPAFLIGCTLFATGLVICGTAPTMAVLVGGRAVQGLGAGCIAAVAYVGIGRAFDERERPRMLAVLSSAWVVPGLVGPALAGTVAQYLSWRLVFLGLVPLAGVAVAAALGPLRSLGPPPRDSAAATDGPRRVRQAVTLAIGAGLVLAVAQVRPVVVAPVVLAAGLALGVPALGRLLPPGSFRAAPGVPAAVATRFLLTMGFFSADFFLPLTLTSVKGVGTAFAGISLTAGTLSWTAGAWLQARLAARVDRRRLLTAGFAFVALGVGLAASLLLQPVPALMAVIAWLVAGLGMGIAYSTITLVVLADAPPAQQGRATASLQLADVLGAALGTGIGGVFVAVGNNSGWSRTSALAFAFATATLAALVGLAAAHRIGPRHAVDAEPEGSPVPAPPP